MTRIPRGKEEERGGLNEREGITRWENVQSQSQRGGDRERGEGGAEMVGSISNFSAEFTVDSFPIRLG